MDSKTPKSSKERRHNSRIHPKSSIAFVPPVIRKFMFKDSEGAPWDVENRPFILPSTEDSPGPSSGQNDTLEPLVPYTGGDTTSDADSPFESATEYSQGSQDGNIPSGLSAPARLSHLKGITTDASECYGVPMTIDTQLPQLASVRRHGTPLFPSMQDQIKWLQKRTSDKWIFNAVIREDVSRNRMPISMRELGSDHVIVKRARGRIAFQRDLLTFLIHLGIKISREVSSYFQEDLPTYFMTSHFDYWPEDPGNIHAEEAFYCAYYDDKEAPRHFWAWFTGLEVQLENFGIWSRMTFPEPDFLYGALSYEPHPRGSCWRLLFEGPIFGDHHDWPTIGRISSLSREYPLSTRNIFRAVNVGGNRIHISTDGNNTAEEILGSFESWMCVGGKRKIVGSDGEVEDEYEQVVDADTAAAARAIMASRPRPPSTSHRPIRKIHPRKKAKVEEGGTLVEQITRYKASKTKSHFVLKPASTVDIPGVLTETDLPAYTSAAAAAVHAKGDIAFHADIYALMAQIGSSLFGKPLDYLSPVAVETFMGHFCSTASYSLRPYYSFIFGHNYGASKDFRELFWNWMTGLDTTLTYPEGWAYFTFSGVSIDAALREDAESFNNGECWRLLFKGPVPSQGPDHPYRFLSKYTLLALSETYQLSDRSDLQLIRHGHDAHIKVGGMQHADEIINALSPLDVVGGLTYYVRQRLLSRFVNKSDEYKRNGKLAPFYKWLGNMPPAYPDVTSICVRVKVTELETALYGYETLPRFIHCASRNKDDVYFVEKSTSKGRLVTSMLKHTEDIQTRLQANARKINFFLFAVATWLIVCLSKLPQTQEQDITTLPLEDKEVEVCDMTFSHVPFWPLPVRRDQQPLIADILVDIRGTREELIISTSGEILEYWEPYEPPDRE